MAFELERLEQSGIKTITIFDERYPQQWLARLASKAPVVLHAAGAVEQLSTPGVGVVGSRNMSEASRPARWYLDIQCWSRQLPM